MFTTPFSFVLLPLFLLPFALAYPKGGIEQQVYDNLVRYTKYSSAVYQKLCPWPLGNTLVAQVRTCYGRLERGTSFTRGALVLRRFYGYKRLLRPRRFTQGDRPRVPWVGCQHSGGLLHRSASTINPQNVMVQLISKQTQRWS